MPAHSGPRAPLSRLRVRHVLALASLHKGEGEKANPSRYRLEGFPRRLHSANWTNTLKIDILIYIYFHIYLCHPKWSPGICAAGHRHLEQIPSGREATTCRRGQRRGPSSVRRRRREAANHGMSAFLFSWLLSMKKIELHRRRPEPMPTSSSAGSSPVIPFFPGDSVRENGLQLNGRELKREHMAHLLDVNSIIIRKVVKG